MFNLLQDGGMGLMNLFGGAKAAQGLPDHANGLAKGHEKSPAKSGAISPEMEQAAQLLPQSGGSGGGLGSLLNNLGLDSLDLSPDAQVSLQYARAQYEVNFQAMRAVSGANGVQMQQVNFSYKASFEFLSLSAGQNIIDPFAPVEGENGEMIDPLARLKEMFNPEKTAERILDFTLGFFPQSKAFSEGGDTEDARSQFADVMREAVQKGFDQALGILGQIPDETREEIDETHDRVFTGFDDFVKNGLDQAKLDDGVYERIERYRIEVLMEMSYTETRAVAGRGYGRMGENQASAPQNSAESAVDSVA